jgi:hypothetical protein
VKNVAWVKSPIDAFVLSALEAKGLQPAPRASRVTLIRRIYFDLIGLPPRPEDVQAFERDPAPDAYEKLINRLLESERYGERWARHWLDVARYADGDGYEYDVLRPDAWRYRDYVIRAFNQDKPYNRFIVEQLAGDMLPNATHDSLTHGLPWSVHRCMVLMQNEMTGRRAGTTLCRPRWHSWPHRAAPVATITV